MKIYVLTIAYSDEKEEIEYITEAVEGDAVSVMEEYGAIETEEDMDDEDLRLISGCHIVGEA